MRAAFLPAIAGLIVVPPLLAAEGDSQWYFYQGNYHEYEANKVERLGEEAAQPHRLRFKNIK